MSSGALAHRPVIDRPEVAPCGVAHSSRGVVHRTAGHTDVRYGHIVSRHIVLVGICPLGVLQTIYSFHIEYVRIGPGNAGRLVDAVKVKYQVVALRHICYIIDLLYGALVLMVEEVHLEAGNSEGTVVLANLLKVFVEQIGGNPQDELHALSGCVTAQLGNVDFRDGFERGQRLVPAFVEDHIFESVLRCEVDVILIGGVIDAAFEVHSVQAEGIPPVPGRQACLNPGGVVDTARRSCLADHIVDRKIGVLSCIAYYSPRESPGAAGDCYIVFVGVGIGRPVLAWLAESVRHRRELSLESGLGLGNEHSGIVFDIGFHQKKTAEVGVLHENGEKGVLLGTRVSDCVGDGVLAFERGTVLVIRAGDERDEHLVAVGEVELNRFAFDCYVVRERGYEAISHTVIIGTHLEGVVTFEPETQVVIYCSEVFLSVIQGVDALDSGAAGVFAHFPVAEGGAVCEFHRDTAVFEYGLAVHHEGVGGCTLYGYEHFEGSGGAGYGVIFRREGQRQNEQQYKGIEYFLHKRTNILIIRQYP